jgi:hypothetical protein
MNTVAISDADREKIVLMHRLRAQGPQRTYGRSENLTPMCERLQRVVCCVYGRAGDDFVS